MVATDFFIVRLDYDMIAKSGHLKGQSGSWVSNAAFLNHQGGHLGHCIIYAPKWQFWPNVSTKSSFGVRECFYYVVLGTPYFRLAATLWFSNQNWIGSGIKQILGSGSGSDTRWALIATLPYFRLVNCLRRKGCPYDRASTLFIFITIIITIIIIFIHSSSY